MIQIDYYKILGQGPRESRAKYLVFQAHATGNPPGEGDYSLFPSGKTVQVKKTEISDDQSHLLSVKGSGTSAIAAGSILVPASCGGVEGKKALVVWKGDPPDNRKLSLSIRELPEYQFTGTVSCNKPSRVSRISSASRFLQIPGQIYVLSDGDYIKECVLLMAEPFTEEEAGKIIGRVNKFGNFPGPVSIYSMNLRVRGFVQVPVSSDRMDFEGALKVENWYLMSRVYDRLIGTIGKRARNEGGIKETDMTELLKVPSPLIRVLIRQLIEQDKVVRVAGYLLNRTDQPEENLSPMARSFLKDLRAGATQGILIKNASLIGRQDLPDILQRRGLARKLEGTLYSEEAYQELAAGLKDIMPRDRSFDLSDLTGKTGLSRSRLICLLDEMERDGLLKPAGDNKRELV